jgi:hypothetical protein
VATLHAWAVERVAQEVMEADQFQVFSLIMTQGRHEIDQRRARQRCAVLYTGDALCWH